MFFKVGIKEGAKLWRITALQEFLMKNDEWRDVIQSVGLCVEES